MARRILVVDDDELFLRAFQRAGRSDDRIETATSAADAIRVVEEVRPDLAIVDLRLGGESGLQLISTLHLKEPELKTVLVSAYLSVAFAVAGVRAGAAAVLFKPITLAEVLHHVNEEALVDDIGGDTPTLARAEWEHITRVLADCEGNVSAAARRLGIYRQSLQRKLRKYAPRD